MMDDVVLEVRGLRTRFGSERDGVIAVDGVDLALRRGRTTALVGESGSGKSATALSIMGLIAPAGRIIAGRIMLDGQDLRAASTRQLEAIRGRRIGMVFQDPLTSLNPALTVGSQVAETILAHEAVTGAEARRRAVALLEQVGVTGAAARARNYPHQFSGGMRQRVLIAAAIACRPDILIADEPTTALDVTIQAKILRLLHDLQQERQMSLLLITHDLGVVAAMADEVLVMYAGRVVEQADVDTLFHAPGHPYTQALLGCMSGMDDDRATELTPIDGAPPDLRSPPPGCRFAPRCHHALAACRAASPATHALTAAHHVACIRAEELLLHA